jgi:hypothetical protein
MEIIHKTPNLKSKDWIEQESKLRLAMAKDVRCVGIVAHVKSPCIMVEFSKAQLSYSCCNPSLMKSRPLHSALSAFRYVGP